MRVDIGGTRLFVDVDGAKLVPDGAWMRERPTVVLVHSGPGFDHQLFKAHLGPRVAAFAQAVYVDLRGHGRSDPASGDELRLDVWAADLHAVCETLELERPVVLGHGFGSLVAARFAAAYPDEPSALVAAAIADVARDPALSFVVCGAYSIDRGSGSVPAFVAAHLGIAQALGCVTLTIGDDGAVGGDRRLDGGRREVVRANGPCVLSVEGGSARLRRAPLHAVVASRDVDVEVVRPSIEPLTGGAARRSPFRPRARVLPPPPVDLSARERILALTGALTEREPPQLLVLDPDAAADRILDQLRTWGYVE